MTLIKCKSKIDASCSFEKDGMKCGKSYKIGEDYLYNPDLKKGYCCSHEELNANVAPPTTKQGGYGGKGSYGAPLCRSPEEGLQAIKIWHETIVPMIIETSKKLGGDPTKLEVIESVTRTYEEIFLGKHTPSQIAK